MIDVINVDDDELLLNDNLNSELDSLLV